MIKKTLVALSLLFSLSTSVFALDRPFDHSVFDQFLKQYVNDKGEVDYSGARSHAQPLDDYLKTAAQIDGSEFIGWPREEQMALAINVYHAGLIRKILNHYPVVSVQKIPDFWQMDAVSIAGRKFGLNSLRKDFLIRNFRDAKVHTALSYAAHGGPKLSRDAFTGPKLEAQLFLAARRFVNDASQNQIRPGMKKITLSKIFEWHYLDLNLDFGAFENERGLSRRNYAVLSFIANYLEDAQALQYLEDARYKVKYAMFDWTLNDWKRPESSEVKGSKD